MTETETEQQSEPQPEREIAVPAVVPKASIARVEEGYILPSNIDEAYRMAQAVVTARLAPDSYGNDPSKVMMGLMAAMEAGLPPLYGLRNIAIINGRPSAWGDALMALVQGKNLLEKQIVREIGPSFDPSASPKDWPDDFGISVMLYRRGQDEPYTGQFTVADAKRANLWMNPRKVPWMQYPKRMLLARARAFPLRDGFADALAGIAVREEIEDHAPKEVVHIDTSHDDEPVEEGRIDAQHGEKFTSDEDLFGGEHED